MPRIAVMMFALAAGVIGLSLGAVAQEGTPGASPSAMEAVTVSLQDVDGQEIGLATFAETPDGQVSIGVSVDGLETGEHGIHIHETGVCDASGDQPFSSAGGHYNPTGTTHGAPAGAAGSVPRGTPEGQGTPDIVTGHAGDLGNLQAADDGRARLQLTTGQFELAELNDEDGSALVIHADPDDLVTDPSGNSGARIACGVIFPPQEGTPAASPAVGTSAT
jgi:Cu-Zn family superoxide dismutase